jgi:hypothetical protein
MIDLLLGAVVVRLRKKQQNVRSDKTRIVEIID